MNNRNRNQKAFDGYGIGTPEGMAQASEWTAAFILAPLNHAGGVWAVPRSGAIYRINQIEKSVVRQAGIDSAVEKVFENLGYRVFDQVEYMLVSRALNLRSGGEQITGKGVELDTLAAELAQFLESRGLKHNDYTAEQLLGAVDWPANDKTWLESFCDRWHITSNVMAYKNRGGTTA